MNGPCFLPVKRQHFLNPRIPWNALSITTEVNLSSIFNYIIRQKLDIMFAADLIIMK